MPQSCFEGATFVKTVVEWKELPVDGFPELAMVGRSNSGKSSALNILANRSRLAFVSKMPGRTQALNYFLLPSSRFVVDLPGYGYAKTARATKADWAPLLGRYVRERTALTGVIMLMDVRRPLTDLDEAFLDWYTPANRNLLILLTKCDKVSNQVRYAEKRRVQAAIEARSAELAARTNIVIFSTLKRIGLEEVGAVIAQWWPHHDQKASPDQVI
jgi:GTP-binding protein